MSVKNLSPLHFLGRDFACYYIYKEDLGGLSEPTYLDFNHGSRIKLQLHVEYDGFLKDGGCNFKAEISICGISKNLHLSKEKQAELYRRCEDIVWEWETGVKRN